MRCLASTVKILCLFFQRTVFQTQETSFVVVRTPASNERTHFWRQCNVLWCWPGNQVLLFVWKRDTLQPFTRMARAKLQKTCEKQPVAAFYFIKALSNTIHRPKILFCRTCQSCVIHADDHSVLPRLSQRLRTLNPGVVDIFKDGALALKMNGLFSFPPCLCFSFIF